jgi:hypothetical protein
VHEVFEGTLTNETKCLCCETVSSEWLFCGRARVCLSPSGLLAARVTSLRVETGWAPHREPLTP